MGLQWQDLDFNTGMLEIRRQAYYLNGKRMPRNVYAHTEEECEEKLAQMIREMKAEIKKLKQGG